MNDQHDWKAIAELVGITAIVASLIFVGMQMRQAQEIAIAEGYSELESSTYARSELISDHSALIAKANSGDQLSDAEAIALEQFVAAMWHSNFFATQRGFFLGRDTGGPAKYLALFFCQNAGLIEIWMDQINAFLEISGEERARASGDMARFMKDVDDAIHHRCGE